MKIFLDSSVIIAALLSPQGGSGRILELCEAKIIKGIISKDVVREIQEAIERKLPELKSSFKKLLKISRLRTIKQIKSSWRHKAKRWISYEKDALILAGAKQANVDFLLTLDLKHFIKDQTVAQKSGLKIYTPGDFLNILRMLMK